MTRLLLAIFVFGLLGVGCTSPGKRLEPSIVQGIREGVTSRYEVHQALGKPDNELTGSNQKRLAVYQYSRLKPEYTVPAPSILPTKAGDIMIRAVSVIFDEQDLVDKVMFHETTWPLQQHMSTIWLGAPISDKSTARIHKGSSNEAELESLFGPPMIRALTVDGTQALIWAYVQIKSRFELREARQTLIVYLDERGIVYDYGVLGNMSRTDSKR